MDSAADQPSKIHVALTFDDKYWAPAYATMRSVTMLSRRPRDIVFHLMQVGLSAAHRASLDSITAEFGSALVYYDIAKLSVLRERIAELPPVGGHTNNPIVYARLFLPDILPADIGRVVYLDCDMLVRCAIEELATLDLEGKPIAAALCPHRTGFQTHRDLRPKRYFSTADLYFNAGMFVLDTAAFREVDVVGSVLQQLTSAEIAELYYDQDILNIAFRNNWKVLGPMWNLQNPLLAHEALDPQIVHYTGDQKPWFLFTRVAFKRMYRHTMTNAHFYRYARERLARRFKVEFLLK